MSIAAIEMYNGHPTVMIDGKPFPPMAMTTCIEKPDYLRNLGESGIRIFFLMANTDWLCPEKQWVDAQGVSHSEPGGFERFRVDAEKLLKCVPDAYIIVRIGMHPPTDWIEQHPDDIMRYSDGATIPAVIRSEVHSQVVPGMYSLCSDAWRKDGQTALEAFCDAADKLPFADRIVGYFLAAGGTSEWYYVTGLIDFARGRTADHSLAFQAEFGRYLLEKYKTVTEGCMGHRKRHL